MIGVRLENFKEDLDKDLRAKVMTFLGKLQVDDTLPGLHIEPMMQPLDARVRTGRVDRFYRAVMFKVTRPGYVEYVYVGTWPHDDAIAHARKMRLKTNPVGGFTEVEEVQDAIEAGHHAGIDSQPPVDPPVLEAWGFSTQQLTEELGFTVALARNAMAAHDTEALLEVAAAVGGWQGDALLCLMDGLSVADIRAKFSLDTPVEHDDDATEDEKILKGFDHPVARSTFVYAADETELKRAIEAGTFGAWRVFLHPEQRRYVDRDHSGPFRLSGGAGTGKTVVLVHRARELWLRNPGARIVLTTYTRNLADMLRANLRQLDESVLIAQSLGQPGVFVTNIDAIIAGVLKGAGAQIATAAEMVLGAPSTHVNNRTDDDAWARAIEAAGAALPANLISPSFFASEYSMVVLPHRIRTRAEYFAVSRAGRGVALNRAKRSAVWSVIEAYRTSARVFGTADWEEAAAIARAHLDLHPHKRSAEHVLVDEGQDLTPTRWQLLRALVADGTNDLFIAEDSHQRIYGQHVVLGRYGIRIVGRSQRLTLNYRTTEQNLVWAVGILAGADFEDAEGAAATASGYHSARSGPAPRLIPCGTMSEELDVIATAVAGWLKEGSVEPESIAVLVRDQRTRSRIATGLSERGVTVRQVDNRTSTGIGHPVVLTMHRSKGTEFSRVVLTGVAKDSVPTALKDEKYDESAWSDALLRERSLLYVAATRARDELVVTWSGDPSSLLAMDASDPSSA